MPVPVAVAVAVAVPVPVLVIKAKLGCPCTFLSSAQGRVRRGSLRIDNRQGHFKHFIKKRPLYQRPGANAPDLRYHGSRSERQAQASKYSVKPSD